MTDNFTSDSLKKILKGRILYLIGMMGSGKSATGPFIAKYLDYRFVDQDRLIEQVAKKSIAEFFNEEGEKEFRDTETKVLKEIGTHHSLVVATGGGVVIRSENWGILHQGIVIWINPSTECLVARLQSETNQRPLLSKNNLLLTLEDLIIKREPLYSEADLQIPVENETPQEVAAEVCEKLSSILINQAD